MHLKNLAAACSACVLLGTVLASQAAEPAITVGIEAEDFQFRGSWQSATDKPEYSGGGYLIGGGGKEELPAVSAVNIPQAGRYFLWVRSLDFPDYLPGTRTFAVSVNGIRADKIFGASGKEGWNWESGGVVELTAGPAMLAIHDVSRTFGRIDALVFTSDPMLKPAGRLGSGKLRASPPVKLAATELPHEGFAGAYSMAPLAPVAVTPVGAPPLAVLENEFVRYGFLPAKAADANTVMPQVSLRRGDDWQLLTVDADAEIYLVTATDDVKMSYANGLPRWQPAQENQIRVNLGGTTVNTIQARQVAEIWRAGDPYRFRPVNATRVGDSVRIDFAPSPVGKLTALWSLVAGQRSAQVKLHFIPTRTGIYSLGYHLFFRRPLDEIEELQVPFLWQRKRLPAVAEMALDPRTPTPLALAQTGRNDDALAWALIGDPGEIPFAWPDGRKPHLGLCIRDEIGNVQPAIYGPIPGTDAARRSAGEPLAFSFRVLVQPGDWYAGYRTAADEVFGLRDYRRNGRVSMSDAVLNMIDLLKDDEYGGWWRRAKGWYQIESRNTVTHAAPATMLSLYRLTGDEDLYQRRVLPTLQYLLSRDSVHFTPTPADPGRYTTGPMGGPTTFYGTSTFSALSALTAGYTPAFARIALPADEKVRPTRGYTHAALFNEWAARYRITGAPADLQQAKTLADEYLAREVDTAPEKPIGHGGFWLLSFVPDWEGLLMMYELTGEKRYLDGAAFGARQLMTGLWTQPVVPEGDTTIFPGNSYDGDPWHGHLLSRGPYMTRLGFPLRADSLQEHPAPAWSVSCVGLGFEQPSTLGNHADRLIYQAVWAPEFLRLARYTGDSAFATYARNAAVGRWATYPGYYAGGHMDLMQDPAYPFVGPDQSTIYYHHIVPHLSWTIDYLLADAELLSNGKIIFPSLRENGYAYFDGKVFGHASGTIFASKDCWLWFHRGAVVVSNPQINTVTAHNSTSFFAILTNQDTKPQSTAITPSWEALGYDPAEVAAVKAHRLSGVTEVALDHGVALLTLQPRELVVIQISGTHIRVPTHTLFQPPAAADIPADVEMNVADMVIKAAAIAASPGPWNAFLWCTATEKQARSVTFELTVDGQTYTQTDTEYPFEYDLTVAATVKQVQFRLSWQTPAGNEERSPKATLSAAQAVP